MDTKRIIPWGLALVFAVAASSQVLLAKTPQLHPATIAGPTRWQYKMILTGHYNESEGTYSNPSDINAMGQQGWELAGSMPEYTMPMTNSGGNVIITKTYLIFKKPI